MTDWQQNVVGSSQRQEGCRSADDFAASQHAAYLYNGQPRGDVWCYHNSNGDPVLMWTDARLNIAVVAIAGDAHTEQDVADLMAWFKHAGATP